MGKKLYIQDIVAIALLYKYKATNNNTISSLPAFSISTLPLQSDTALPFRKNDC